MVVIITLVGESCERFVHYYSEVFSLHFVESIKFLENLN